MISALCLKIFLTTLISLTFLVAIGHGVWGENWYKQNGPSPAWFTALGGFVVLISALSFFVGATSAVWGL